MVNKHLGIERIGYSLHANRMAPCIQFTLKTDMRVCVIILGFYFHFQELKGIGLQDD